MWTGLPSSKFNRLYHVMVSLTHRKFSKNMIPASTARRNAHFLFAGLLNVLYMKLNSLRRKVCTTQRAYNHNVSMFSLPFTNKFHKLFAKSITQTLFCNSTWLAHSSHVPSQRGMDFPIAQL